MAEEFVPPPPSSDESSVSPIQIGGVLAPENVPVPQLNMPPLLESPSGLVRTGGGGAAQVARKNPTSDIVKAYLGDKTSYQKRLAPGTEVGTYDADYTGLNFARYYNTPRVFKKVGFSPFRDNEAVYNQNMTWFDGFKRSVGQAVTMGSISFSGMLPWNAWDMSTDDPTYEQETIQRRAASIGMDTRGTAGAWLNSQVFNAGYTVGMIAELALEEAAIAGIGMIPGLQAPAAGAAVAKFAQFGKQMANFNKFRKGMKLSLDTMDGVRNINLMRDMFNVAKQTKAIGRVFLPNTYDAIKTMYKGGMQGKGLSKLAMAGRTFGGFYRDARQVAAAMSESKIEAGMVEADMYDSLTDKFYNENGRLPGYEEASRIRQHAEEAGKETFLWNMPAIYFSNKIVFDKALRGILPSRILRAEAGRNLGGKFVMNQKWYKTPGQKAWEFQKSLSPMAAARRLFKPKQWNVKNLTKDFLGSMLMYTKANFAEGLQEVYQESVSATMKDYYTNKYNNPNVWGARSLWGDFMKNSEKMVKSPEGLSVFASGFLMGGLIQVPQTLIFDYGSDLRFRLTDAAGYQQFKEQQDRKAQATVDALNYVTEARPQEWMKPSTTNAAAQGNLDADSNIAEQEGDVKGYKDIVNDQIGEHLHTLIETGHIELFEDTLDDFEQMNEEEMIDAFGKLDASLGDAKTYYGNKIRSLREDLQFMKDTYEAVEESIVNPYDYTSINKEKDPQGFIQMWSAHEAMRQYKKTIVMGRHHYAKTLSRMVNISNDFVRTPGFKGIPATELNILFSSNFAKEAAFDVNTGQMKPGSLAAEMSQLEMDISALEGMTAPTAESKKSLKLKKERLKLLENYSADLNIWMSTYKDYEKARREGSPDLEQKEEAVEATLQGLKRSYEKYILFTAEHNGVDMESISTFEIFPNSLSEEGRKIVGAEVRKLERQLSKEENGRGRRNLMGALEDDINLLLSETPEAYYEKYLERARANNDVETIEDLEKKIKEIKARQKEVRGEKVSGIYLSEDRVLSPGMEEAFAQLVDFYTLTNDKNELIEAINVLHNPNIIARTGAILAEVMESNFRNKQETLKKMYDEFNSKIEKNDILVELSKINVFFDPKYIDEFMKGRLDDIVFYKYDGKNITAVDSLPDAQRNETMRLINEILDKYLKSKGITGRPITGQQPESEYNAIHRDKLPNDKRTYEDLAKQYGFDPNATQSEVNMKQVLQSIIDSEFALPQERMLAKRFLDVVGDLQVVKFRNNHPTPGSYSSLEGTVVDARYSSNDYKGGTVPLEFVILHEVGHLLTVEAYDKDATFKSAIDKLYTAALQSFEKDYPQAKPLYGFKNQKEFITETLSNPMFQSYLSTIPYAATGKTLWTEFLDAVMEFISKLLNVPKQSSLLDEALYVITSQIGTPETGGPLATKPGGPILSGGGGAGQITTPVKAVSLMNRNGDIPGVPGQKLGFFFEGLNLHYDLQSQPEVYNMLVDKLGKDAVDMLKGKVFALNGQWMFNHGGNRLVMFMHVGNGVVPVYFSSAGTSGKALTWHPFFGIDSDTGWIFKETYYPDRKITQLDEGPWPSYDSYKDALPILNAALTNLDTNLNVQSFKTELLRVLPTMDLEGPPKGLFRGQNIEASRDQDGVSVTPHASNYISIILQSILKDGTMGKTVEQQQVSTEKPKYLNQGSSPADLKPILPQLLAAYKEFEADQNSQGRVNLNPNYATMSDDEIVNSAGFRQFLMSNAAVNIMTDYNAANQTMPKSQAEMMNRTITAEDRKALKDLGYTDGQINEMTKAEADLNIAEKIRADREKTLQEKMAEIQKQAEQDFILSINTTYDAIDPTQDDARQKLFEWLTILENPSNMAILLKNGITSDVWGPMFQSKLELIKKVEPLTIGEFYILDGKLYKMVGTKDMKYRLVPHEQLALEEKDRTEVKIDFNDLNNRNIRPAPRPKDAQAPATPAPTAPAAPKTKSVVYLRPDSNMGYATEEQARAAYAAYKKKEYEEDLEKIPELLEYLKYLKDYNLADGEISEKEFIEKINDPEYFATIQKLNNEDYDRWYKRNRIDVERKDLSSINLIYRLAVALLARQKGFNVNEVKEKANIKAVTTDKKPGQRIYNYETAPAAPVSDKKADIESKIKKLFEFTERGQISLAGEEYDLIQAVRNNPTDENIKEFLKLYKSEIGKYEQSIVDEVDSELAALGAAPAPVTGVQGTLDFADELTNEEKTVIDDQMPDSTVDDVDRSEANKNSTDDADSLFGKDPDNPDLCI